MPDGSGLDPIALALGNPAAALRSMDLWDARDSLHKFCGMIEIPGAPVDEDEDADAIGYVPIRTPQAAHHRLMIDVLEAVESGRVLRAMFFLPPGAAKSTYCSVVFPPWFMGRRRRRNVIVATYASDLARKLGRRCRSIVRQPVYSEIFDRTLSADVGAADNWTLDNDNEFMGGGILSGITGNRADLIVIDDPVKGRQDADSPAIQVRTRGEFDDSLRTRLKPGGRMVIVQTRWNEKDLAGGLLPEGYDGRTGWVRCTDDEYWYVVNVPAQAERADDPLGRKVGEYIWPEWFDASHWRQFQANPRTWSALYQQRPAPATGTYFKAEWFAERWHVRPLHRRTYMSSDHAPAGQVDSDYQVLRVWDVDEQGRVYLIDGVRGQFTMDVLAEHARQLIVQYRPSAWFPEDDNNWKAAAPFIRKYLRNPRDDAGNLLPRAPCRIEPVSPHGADKEVKATSFQALASMGMVVLPAAPMRDGSTAASVLTQYLAFPAGAHDDEVDAAGVLGRALDEVHAGVLPAKREEEKRERYKKRPARAVWAK